MAGPIPEELDPEKYSIERLLLWLLGSLKDPLKLDVGLKSRECESVEVLGAELDPKCLDIDIDDDGDKACPAWSFPIVMPFILSDDRKRISLELLNLSGYFTRGD